MSIASTTRVRVLGASAGDAALAAFKVINVLQDIHPDQQVLGLAAAFKVTAEVLQLDPRELLGVVGRMQDDCTFQNLDTFNAVSAYVDGEIKRRFA